MGGGKGHIHHYVTPVKAHRIIVEVGGKCEYAEVIFLLLKSFHFINPYYDISHLLTRFNIFWK